MKSFKKLALGLVAAMTVSTLIATPASAAPMTVALDVNGTANTTASASATPAQLPVPSDNEVNAADALRFVATVDTGTAVTASCTNCTIVSALHTSTSPVNASSGSASLTIATGTGTSATFYVYTKTTAIGTVVVITKEPHLHIMYREQSVRLILLLFLLLQAALLELSRQLP